jgi:tRNA threonylcarbamoyladenosine biosynthesis protein TsaE
MAKRSEAMSVYRTLSAPATQELARALAAVVVPGDLVLLIGEMGAGKTAFAQGFAAGLGIGEPVTSPTFTLVRHYRGRLPMHHVDVYRLDSIAEVADLGLSELLDSDGVTIIEWGDAIVSVLPSDHLQVALSFGATPDERRIEIRALGSWAARSGALEACFEAWRC